MAGLSIGEITRRLKHEGAPTRKSGARWERSTVWAMLRNPAYCGLACFGKTQLAPRQRVNNRALRRRGGVPARNSASHEQPREQWIGIPVPALVAEDTFALAQERLATNKKHAARRTIEASILQGLVHCRHCGYALYRTSTKSSARKIYYYRCLGSDAWRYEGKARCDQKPIRLDLLEHIVWTEIVRLLEDPALIQGEINRRLDAARNANPAKRRQDSLTRELMRVRKSMDRLLTAYQEELLSLDELRRRMPSLRQREQGLQAELQSLNSKLADQAAYLQLAETLSALLRRLRANSETLDIRDRQRITRLLVKEIVVADDSITIRHSIPTAARSPGGNNGASDPTQFSAGAQSDKSYLLCPWRVRAALGLRRDRLQRRQGEREGARRKRRRVRQEEFPERPGATRLQRDQPGGANLVRHGGQRAPAWRDASTAGRSRPGRSRTKELLSFNIRLGSGAKDRNQSQYLSSPSFPYSFFRFKANGGEVRMRSTDFSKTWGKNSSVSPRKASP